MVAAVQIQLALLDSQLPVPRQARSDDAGFDLHARAGVTLAPGHRALVPTGIAIAIPTGYAGFVHPRSGLASRHGLSIVNAPGVIDAGYRGEIQVNLINLDPREPFTIARGDRIAQLVVQAVAAVEWETVSQLPDSERGDGGHGSSGGWASAQLP